MRYLFLQWSATKGANAKELRSGKGITKVIGKNILKQEQ